MLSEQNRRQPLAAVDRGFVCRTPCIEKLNELLARAVIIPFAVALDDGDQLLERILPPALAVERQRKIEARLMIERISEDLLFELGNGAERLGLLGEFERGARRRDRGVVLFAVRHHGKRLPRLVERAGLDVAAPQARKRRRG